MRTAEILVVGGGIVGLAAARALAVGHGRAVTLLEAGPELAAHQTGHNSGVIHAGLYYRPGSRKAETCAAGRRAIYAYLAERGIPHERCGKLVVALDEAELTRLDELERRGRANGLVGLERLDASGLREVEPHAAGVAALHVAETGIVDYRRVAAALADDLRAAGGRIETAARVTGIRRRDGQVIAETSQGARWAAPFLVGCAGLGSDRLAVAAGLEPGVRIVPFRGDYCELVPAARHLVRGLIYPVPDPDLPFLGVHFTRRIDGAIEAGPNAVLAWKREGYSRAAFSPADAMATLGFPGFWRFAPRYAGIGWREYRRAWSRRRFAAELRRLLPELTDDALRPAGCGVRAQALGRDGRLVDDFVWLEADRMLHVLNAPSPAATASLAIGEEIAARAAIAAAA